jgi:hypothetical protein
MIMNTKQADMWNVFVICFKVLPQNSRKEI